MIVDDDLGDGVERGQRGGVLIGAVGGGGDPDEVDANSHCVSGPRVWDLWGNCNK